VNTRWSTGSPPPTLEWGQFLLPEVHSAAQLRKKPLATQRISYFAVLLFSIICFARPEDWVPGTRAIPVAKIAGSVALGAFLLNLLVRKKLNLSRAVLLLLALFGQLCLAIPFSAWRGGSFELVLYDFSKIVLIVLLLVQAVDTFPRLRQLIFVQTVAVITISLVSLINKSQLAGRLNGSVGGIFDNPNDLAANLCLVMPFCIAFLHATRNMIKKGFWLCTVLLLSYALGATLSRGGFLAMLAATAGSLWYIGAKARRSARLMLVLPFVIGVLLLLTVRINYATRIQSIVDPTLDQKGSFAARQGLLIQSLRMAANHPLLGVGPGEFPEYSKGWYVAHNSYTELAAEAGIPAAIFFIWIFVDSFVRVKRISANKEFDPEIRLFAGALSASLIAFFVVAFFSSIEYVILPYFLMSYCVALVAIALRNRRRTESGHGHGHRVMKLEHQPCVG
jgi:putative inorganic carbon (hco3(-)) transporter